MSNTTERADGVPIVPNMVRRLRTDANATVEVDQPMKMGLIGLPVAPVTLSGPTAMMPS